MFSSNKFLVYIRKPSVYNLRRMMPEQQRVQYLKQIQQSTSKPIPVSNSNPVYRTINQIVKKQRQQQLQKYQDSFLWSPHFTPQTFKWRFLPFFILTTTLILYIHYISVPRAMMQWKKKLGIRFEQLQKSGRLDGWYDEYQKPDKVLEFEAHTLQDLKNLHKQGLLTKNQQKLQENINKKKSKFVKGNKQFMLNQFKST